MMVEITSTPNRAAPVERTSVRFDENADGLVLAHSQDIPTSWTSWVAELRKESWENRKNSEHIHVASIPVVFVHKWLREGFNIYHEPMKEIVKRVHRENLQGFLVTEKKAI